ncbi:MAG: ABC transporter permease subunit [Peptococcaceae bacterium]|nr:ABC transporter permease subunit [Peptococcaceae bacterium]
MNLGLMAFKLRQNYRTALYVTIGFLSFGLLMVAAYDAFDMQNMMGQMLQGGGEDIMRAMLGTQGVLMWDVSTFLAMAWRHPIILVILVGWAASLGSGYAAKEIGEKTADLLFARPMSRSKLLAHDLLVAGSLLFINTMLFSLSLYFGALSFGLNPPRLESFAIAGLQYFVFALAVLSIAYLLGAWAREGKVVVGAMGGLFAAMYTIELVGGLWDAVEPLKTFSLFTYLTPHAALTQNASAWTDLYVLLGVTTIAMSLSFVLMERRDLS